MNLPSRPLDLVDIGTDRLDDRGVVGAQNLQRHPGIPGGPGLLEVRRTLVPDLASVQLDHDSNNVPADRECLGDRVLGEPEIPVTGTMTYGVVRQRARRLDSQPEGRPGPVVIGADAGKSTTKLGTATTTTQAPSVNLEKRKTMVAIAVTAAPDSVDRGSPPPPRRSLPPPVHDQTALGQGEAGEDADGEQRDQSVRVALDRDSSAAEVIASAQIPLENTCRSPRSANSGAGNCPSQQAGEHGKATKGSVRGERQDKGDGERDHVVGPVTTDGHRHDLAEDCLVRSWPDLPAASEDRQADQHGPEDHPEQQLGALRPRGAGFFEERDAICDGLDAGQRAATGGERLQDKKDPDGLDRLGRDQRAPR